MGRGSSRFAKTERNGPENMALKSSKKTAVNTYELELLLDKASFDAEVMKVYRRSVGRMNVPGFRRGKAPKSVVEKMYGKTVFYDDALETLVPPLYEEAVAQAKLDVVSRPDIELVSVEDDGVLLKATVTVKPTVKLDEYKGFQVYRPEVTVTEEEIDREIDAVRQRNARVLTVEDRPAETGDDVVIDFKGYRDGTPFEGGEAEKQTLKLGSNTFIPGFEDQIVGHSTGDAFTVSVTFPEDYHESTLAGQPATFDVKLHEIKKTELPELDDEFVKDVSEFDTLDAYKESVKTKIEERKNASADAEVERQLIDQLIGVMTAEVPECMIESEIDRYVNDYDYRLRSQGASLDLYYQYTGSTPEALRKSFRAEAERQVKSRLALEKVAKSEKLKAGKKEIEEEYRKIASGYAVEMDYVKQNIPEDGIVSDLLAQKAIKVLRDSAVVTVGEKPAEEPAEKPVEKPE